MEIYKTGKFVDASGKVRKFVVCGILRDPEAELMLASVITKEIDGGPLGFGPIVHKKILPVMEYENDGHVRSNIFLGISVCSASDTFDLETGKKIAMERALISKKPQKWIATDFPDIFTETLLDHIVSEYARMVSKEPEKYAVGYYESEYKDKYQSLTKKERLIVDALQQGECDLDKLADIAKNYIRPPRRP